MNHKNKQTRLQKKMFISLVYPLLFVAAICTMVPLIWLIGSSFKTADEIFAVPIRWFPKLPPRINSSPYVVSTAYPKIKKPKSVDNTTWQTLQPALENVIREKAQLHIDAKPQVIEFNLKQDLITEITEGVWQQTISTLPNNVWDNPTMSIVTQLEKSIIPEMLNTIWNNVYRQIAIESIEIEDIEFNRYKIDPGIWNLNDSYIEFQNPHNPSPINYIYNEFTEKNNQIFNRTVQSPVPIDHIRRIILPVRGDASYHHLSLSISTNTTTFIPNKPFVIDSALRKNSIWRLHGIPGELESSQITMNPIVIGQDLLKNQTTPDPENTLNMELTIHRPSYLSIVLDKFTSNYRKLWEAVPYNRYFINSVYIATSSTLLALFFCSLGGFAFAKYQFRGKTILFGIVLASMMVPFQVLLVPLFGLMYDIGWLNSYNAIIFPFSVGAFGVFLMRQFIVTIPSELLDAARIDGCSEFGIYYRIVLPIIKPALGALTIYTFLSSWNGYLWPLIVLRDDVKYTLPLGLASLVGIYRQEYGMLMAGTLLSLLPIVVLFLAMQREFVQGITLGSVKE